MSSTNNKSNGVQARAAVLEKFNEPLVVREFPVAPPEPKGLVVACTYGGICGTDLHLQQGHLDIPTPIVLGHEGLGRVHSLGDGLTQDAEGTPLEVGDAVMWASSIACGMCVPCLLHREPTLCMQRRTCGVNRPTTESPSLSGSWADYIYLRPRTTVVRLPDEVDPLAAMSFACAGPTMVHALYERRPVRVGESVVVQGSGPVGLAAAALAKLGGASKVILVGGPAKRLDIAKSIGIADHFIDIFGSDDSKAVLARVRELTGGHGADLVIECAGVPEAVAQGMYMCRRSGSYLIIGQYTDAGDVALNPHQIVYRQLDVVGSWAFSGAHLVEYVKLLPQLIARFRLGELVEAFPLAGCNEAMAAVAQGKVMKAVLHPY